MPATPTAEHVIDASTAPVRSRLPARPPGGIRDGNGPEPSGAAGRTDLAMTLERTQVLFFDPASYASRRGVKAAAAEVVRHARLGRRVAVVAAADPERVHAALTLANALPATGDDTEQAEILARPHVEAAERLAVAVRELGVRVTVLEPAEVGPTTRGVRLDAEPRRLDVPAVAEALSQADVVVLPAGVGRTEEGAPSVLGAGGEELSAVFVADRLAAPLRLVREEAERTFTSISHDDAVRSDGRVISRRAALYARRRWVRYEIGSAGRDRATFVGDVPTLGRQGVCEHRVRSLAAPGAAATLEVSEPEYAGHGC